MSFFNKQHDNTRRENLDSRISAWRDNRLNMTSSPGPVQVTHNTLNSALGSSTQSGKIVTPVNPNRRDDLTNVRGSRNTNKSGPSSMDTEYCSVIANSAWSGTPPASVRGQSGNTPALAGSASRISGPSLMPHIRGASAKNAADITPPYKGPTVGPNSVAKISVQSSELIDQTLSSSSKQCDSKPPHLRSLPSADPVSTTQPTRSDSQAPHKMNSGIVAKSAKDDSKFPCTYKDCTRGFATEKSLKNHKDEQHEWCRLCKIDFQDFDELLAHKVHSERHICCVVCGEDFRSTGGRDKHQRQMHATEQNIKCPGCGSIFEKGASLIAHIFANQCKSQDGELSKSVNELKIRETRVAAALHMNQLLNRPSRTGALIAAMQPPEIEEVQSVDNSVGGVALAPNSLDNYAVCGGIMQTTSKLTGMSNLRDDHQSTVKGGGSVGTDMTDMANWPTVEDSKAMGKKKETPVIQGLSALTVNDSHGSGTRYPRRSAVPEIEIKPIPIMGEWPAPRMPDFRRNILPSQSGFQHVVRTDWDAVQFERHGLDGHYHCPFTGCKANYLELNNLLYHLTSGFHQGTDHRCLKCLRVFKSAQALVAHMESNSERCKMKESDGFGNVLHVVSGGFLGVKGRHTDGTIKIEAPDVPEEERYKLHTEDDSDDDDDDESLEMFDEPQPRMLMPHERKQPTADEMLR